MLLIIIVIAGAGCIILMRKGDLTRNDALASVLSLFVSLISLAIVILTLPERIRSSGIGALADDLAEMIRAEWQAEARARQLRDSPVVPLRWSAGGIAGRMSGTFGTAIEQMATAYHDAGIGRTVILGEPGAGKTVLAIMLTLGLLKNRVDRGPLPVLLGLSSWDPTYERLDPWIVRTVAQSYYNGQQDTPQALLDGGLLIPILDGLDEIPEVSRRNAVEGINYIGDDRPVVVTCRSAEYEDVIKGGSVSLHRAPVVRVLPLGHDEVIGYLRSSGPWPPGTTWDAVSAEMRRDPEGPLATALSTPLMVSFARMVYQRLGGDPGALADGKDFPTRYAIEDYLVDRVIEAAYSPDRLPSGEVLQEPEAVDPQKAERWLTYLAQYLNDNHERDLTWWWFADRMLPAWVVYAICLVVAFVLMLVASVTTVLADQDHDMTNALRTGAMVGMVIAFLSLTVWAAGVGRRPGGIVMAASGSVERLLRGLRVGAALIVLAAVGLVIQVLLTLVVGDTPTFEDVGFWVRAFVVTVAAAGVVGAALAAHNWFDAQSEHPVRANPFSSVAQDRWSSLIGALAAAIVVAATLHPVLWLSSVTGGILGDGFAGWLGQSGTSDLDWAFVPDPAMVVLFIGGVAVFPGIAVGLLILLTRAWPRFVVMRCVLAARRQLPLRLMRFLGDARSREVLRQSGGAYQFRHVRLQERLASRPRIFDRASAPPTAADRARARRRRRIAAALTAPVMAAATIVVGVTFNELRCAGWSELGAGTDQVRTYDHGASYCVGIVREDRWDEFVLPGMRAGAENERREAVLSALAEGNANLPNDASTLAVLGPLTSRDDPAQTTVLRQLAGVAAAQRSAAQKRRPLRIVLVDTGPVRSDNTDLAATARVVDGSARAGAQLPTMLILNPGAFSAIRSNSLERIPNRVLPLFAAYFEFGGDLEYSMLWRFAAQQLNVDLDYVDRFPSSDSCARSGKSVQQFMRPVEEFPPAFDKSYLCEDNQVSLVVSGRDVAAAAEKFITATDLPNVTIYYPDRGPAAEITCGNVADALQGFVPDPNHVCTVADRPALFTYRTGLAVAGAGEYTLYEVRCTRPPSSAPVTCDKAVATPS